MANPKGALALLPPCTATQRCGCAYMVSSAKGPKFIRIWAPGAELVRVTTSNFRVQIRLRCIEHGNVGGTLPHRALIDGKPINAGSLPERYTSSTAVLDDGLTIAEGRP